MDSAGKVAGWGVGGGGTCEMLIELHPLIEEKEYLSFH